jgi:hypothetical protein
MYDSILLITLTWVGRDIFNAQLRCVVL